ncbi:nitrite reductase small subunit NirD [Halalkalibacterium ligniniphilum]|uniref:nitrite reductase small subunit NirD n=1 Tax=Halalkalibacterium ligniniphilum TaxID=1134413 RepID=UPI000349F9CD|nr:nitrite reductase small subunit NirD [Halalkalibacterium ligniniphilum]
MTVKDNIKSSYIGHINEFKEKIGKEVVFEDAVLAVFKLEDGSIKAIENRCPHKGGPLSDGIVSGSYVFCPLHDWKLSLEDGKVQFPDEGCVKSYRTTVINGEVYVER